MHEVKKPFAGIKKLSIWHGKPFFLLQKPFFFENQTFLKNLFFHKVELTACAMLHHRFHIFGQIDLKN